MHLSNRIIEAVITKTAGKEFLPLVNELRGKKEESELRLANAIKRDINVTRSMLYKLSGANLVESKRVKDKRKGWYIYYWSLKQNSIKYLAKKSREDCLNRLNAQLKREKDVDYFSCSGSCCRLSFEKATDLNFKCPECGALMQKEDNSSKIEIIIKEIKKINESIKCGVI